MTRAERLRILAWSLPDTLPAPTITRSHAIPGETPDAWLLCPTCNGEKKLRGNVCGECRGAGRYKADTYTDARVSGEGAVAAPRSRSTTCDRCNGSGVILARYVSYEGSGSVSCVSCQGTGHLEVPISRESAPVVLDDPRNRRRAKGSYDELEAAIAAIPHHRVVSSYLDWAQELQPRTFNADDGEMLLLDAMPLNIRVPRDVVTAWHAREERKNLKENSRRLRVSGDRQSRRRRIMQMFMEGKKAEDIADVLHVHASTVRRVIGREHSL